MTRTEKLMPDGIPKYLRCYDNDGDTFDRYIVVFGKKKANSDGFLFLTMSEDPFHPQGFGQHDGCWEPIDRPKYSHLGKKIKFSDLPERCQQLVIEDYKELWDLN